ncbi:MAG: hypothetical protein HY671_04165 [Chloroflexi bacterium]|nr:hypothetical protein [Chloroflexota bacterium]
MRNRNNLGWVANLVIAMLLIVAVHAMWSNKTSAADAPPRTFLRARLTPGTITAQVSGQASLEVTVDSGKGSTPVTLTQGQPVAGEVQVPFAQGTYVVKLLLKNSDQERETLRVRGSLIAKGPGIYEHTSVETLADPAALGFAAQGSALVLEAGSVRGSAVLLFMPAKDQQYQVALTLDSNGDGRIGDDDVRKEGVVQGQQAEVETPAVDGLPLTSTVRAEVRSGAMTVLKIEGPYDLANMQASAKPSQELAQDQVKAFVVFIKRVPVLTRVEIPAVRLAPPPETVRIQPQNPAQSTVSAFGDASAVKSLLQSVHQLDESPTTTGGQSLSGVQATPVPGESSKVTPTPAEGSKTGQPSEGPLEGLGKALGPYKGVLIPAAIVFGVILVAVLVVLILWAATARNRQVG